jgi:C4-dicarboxylate-specific signal transduction histidine kinase
MSKSTNWDELGPDTWAHLGQMAEFGVLSASLLHELRQPLFAVKAIAQIARRREKSLDEEGLGQLLTHVVQIEELLDHYAGYGRLNELDAVFDLNLSVGRAMDMLAHRARQFGVSIDPRLSSDSLLVKGKPGSARQVAVNLLQNALDALEGAPKRTVILRSERRERHACLVVQDNGPGVPEAVRPSLFEPFVTTKEPGRGTGLGLYIAKKLCEEMNGTLELEFPEEGGTRVEVLIPIES